MDEWNEAPNAKHTGISHETVWHIHTYCTNTHTYLARTCPCPYTKALRALHTFAHKGTNQIVFYRCFFFVETESRAGISQFEKFLGREKHATIFVHFVCELYNPMVIPLPRSKNYCLSQTRKLSQSIANDACGTKNSLFSFEFCANLNYRSNKQNIFPSLH